MAAIQERGSTGFLSPAIKMEVQDSVGPESEDSKERAGLPERGSGGEESEQTVKQESQEEPSRTWDAQLERFLRTLQSPSGGETLQQSHPQEPQTMTADDESHLDATHSGKEGTAGKGAVELETGRQHFRMFIYQEAVGPRNFWWNLRNLCRKWLMPERHTKEQILDLVTLEQFLAALPPEMQKWLRELCPQTCFQAVALAEDFILNHREPKGCEGQITEVFKKEFVNPPEAKDPNMKLLIKVEYKGTGNENVLDGAGLTESEEQNPQHETTEGMEQLMTSRTTDKKNSFLFQSEPDWNKNGANKDSGTFKRKAEDPVVSSQGVYRNTSGDKQEKYEKNGKHFNQDSHLVIQEDPDVEEKRYTCWNCSESFSSSSDLMIHERAHVGEKMYKCFHCGKFERTHKNLVPCRCSHCGNTCWWNQKDEIQTGDKIYTCSKCGEQCSRKSDLLKHERTHRRCSFCGVTFTKDSCLKLHQRIHTGGETYTCQNSEESFSMMGCLIPHEGIHTEICSYCGKRFSQKTELAEHEKTHEAEHTFVPFEVSSELVAHVRTDTEKPFECSVCGKMFENSLQRTAHQKLHKGKKQHTCSSCGKSFTQIKSLIIHKRIHARQNPHKGSMCGENFKNFLNFKCDERIHRSKKLHKCSHCDKTFRWTSDLELHELIHTEEKPFNCSDCGECFNRRSSLLEHSRSHTGQSPFTCSYCGKMFTSNSVLLRHQKFHVAEKVCTCSQCGKTFKQQSDQVEEKASKCPECTRSHDLSSDLVCL
nr:PREDICTED: zinc finger and SCAN domain-containing protein 2 isoform X2 [Anolis carolinensis]|eukprot:XP_008104052.1 PREDICTED: zinc finger and SCAN domain-containing protein 2 isoform X2 [Anolis carolinensis]